MKLMVEPLTHQAFAPFGDVVAADREDRVAAAANLGTAERRDYLVDLVNARPQAKLNVACFRCRPFAQPLRLSVLEKHPASTQLFVPMTPGAFLVVVAEGDDEPRLETARAFLVEGGRGVAYAPGTWHHPMIALGGAIDFSCFVWEDGSPLDCVTTTLAEALTVELVGARSD